MCFDLKRTVEKVERVIKSIPLELMIWNDYGLESIKRPNVPLNLMLLRVILIFCVVSSCLLGFTSVSVEWY